MSAITRSERRREPMAGDPDDGRPIDEVMQLERRTVDDSQPPVTFDATNAGTACLP